MDQHKLRTLVFEKTGVKVDIDDPIFALVALNEAVLAEAVERHVARIDAASAALAARLGVEDADMPSAPLSAQAPAPAAMSVPSSAPPPARLLPLALGAAAFGAVLVLLGQALFFRPAPAAPVPPALTSAQIAAIATGEKFERILPRLDTRTRTAVQAEMGKP